MPSNRAAWQNKIGDKLDVRSAPYTAPAASQLVIKAHAWAVNPVDCVLQSQPHFDWLRFPLILGCDVAGEVVEVGSGVSDFALDDRICALSLGSASNDTAQGGFQEYVVVETAFTSRIPKEVDYAQASVFPLCLATAASALFQRDYLAMPYPELEPKPAGKMILVWGGSSAVGCNAIQLATAAGYSVITTASKENTGLLRCLGATQVFDYKSDSVINDIVAAVESIGTLAGIFQAAGEGSVEACLDIAAKISGGVFVATSLPITKKPENVEAKMCFASTIQDNGVAAAVFGDFFPKALAIGKYKVAPEPMVIAQGLKGIQAGFERQRKGVSARKVVITL